MFQKKIYENTPTSTYVDEIFILKNPRRIQDYNLIDAYMKR